MPYHIRATQAEGRFRGGVKHTKEGRAWADSELTKQQLDVIKRDPVLVVKELSAEEYAALREEEQKAMEEAAPEPPAPEAPAPPANQKEPQKEVPEGAKGKKQGKQAKK